MHMDASAVQRLAAGGETLHVEFKSDRAGLGDSVLVEAVACMANGGGGVVLVGVEDDGTITGARPRHGGSTHAPLVQALIANKTVPPLSTTVTVVDVQGAPVIAVEVEATTTPTGTSSGVYTRRAMTTKGAPQCVPYAFHEMFARLVDVGQVDHARTVLNGARVDDLDPLEFERYRAACRIGGDTTLAALEDTDLARALGVLGPDDTVCLGAMLLFGRPEAMAEFAPTHEVLLQVLKGSAIEASVSSRAPLLAAAQDLAARLSAYNREEEFDFGLLRVAVPQVSPVAIREVVANALVHRDYTQLGAVHVQWDDDGLTVASPGGFPDGITVHNLLRDNKPRSPLLAEAFKRAGLVERSGRGVNRMVAETLRLGRTPPDYSRSNSSRVAAVFSLGAADLSLARYVAEEERRLGGPLPLPDLQVLSRLHDGGSLTVAEAAELLQRTDAETRTALGRMIGAGLVEQRGTGRGTRYHLTAAVYRALGERSAYVRVQGFSPLQNETMVDSYVRAHGRITRAQAAELCGLTPQQATLLLRRLVDQGRLVRHGERRGAHYRLPQ